MLGRRKKPFKFEDILEWVNFFVKGPYVNYSIWSLAIDIPTQVLSALGDVNVVGMCVVC